jgi:hypothetical protein
MTRPLKVDQNHDLYQATNVKGIGRWIKTNITRCDVLVQMILCFWHNVVQHASPTKFFNKIFLHCFDLKAKIDLCPKTKNYSLKSISFNL